MGVVAQAEPAIASMGNVAANKAGLSHMSRGLIMFVNLVRLEDDEQGGVD
jgi:hypothetical protein